MLISVSCSDSNTCIDTGDDNNKEDEEDQDHEDLPPRDRQLEGLEEKLTGLGDADPDDGVCHRDARDLPALQLGEKPIEPRSHSTTPRCSRQGAVFHSCRATDGS